MDTRRKQCQEIWRYMVTNGPITQRIAGCELDIWRLSARIWDLKHQGFPISSESVTVETRFGKQTFKRYYIDAEKMAFMCRTVV